MAGTTPEETIALFATYLGDGDLSSALTLFAPEATFRPDPATVVTGTEAVEEGLRGFFALKPTLTPGPQRVMTSGSTALVLHEWQLKATLPDGSPLEQRGRATDVLQRQADGQWLLVIDNPWGEAALQTET